MNEQRISGKREAFFAHFRGRHETVSRDDVKLADRLILVSVCLDALAKHWADTTCARPRFANGADRLRTFLARHGGHPSFERVSTPFLRDLATSTNGPHALPVGFPFHRYADGRMNRVHTWENDPRFDDLLQFTETDTVSRKAPITREILISCSYGGVIYGRLRCAWVHEAAPTHENVMTPTHDTISNEEPFYRYVSYWEPDANHVSEHGELRGQFRLVLPLPFLLRTIERAVDSFEAEANATNILPFRPVF